MSTVSENLSNPGEPLLPVLSPEPETVSGGDPLPEADSGLDASGEVSDPIVDAGNIDTEALIAAINDGSAQIVSSQESGYTVVIILLAFLVGVEWIKGFFVEKRG